MYAISFELEHTKLICAYMNSKSTLTQQHTIQNAMISIRIDFICYHTSMRLFRASVK